MIFKVGWVGSEGGQGKAERILGLGLGCKGL